ncbi:MAG: Ig-like domain-containing protein [Cytophagaceae bacterium]|jgi:chitinase|nr:Ig-like domain-containing protein [Cytophagaceae bacterium]
MKHKRLFILLSAILLANTFSCKKKEEVVATASNNSNQAPTVQVSLTDPTVIEVAMRNTKGNLYTISAEASASDADGSIIKVEFYLNETKVSTDSIAPYELSTNTTQTSGNTVYAIAFDNGGASTKSNVVSKSFTK